MIRRLFGVWLVFRCGSAEGVQFKTFFIDAKNGWVGCKITVKSAGVKYLRYQACIC